MNDIVVGNNSLDDSLASGLTINASLASDWIENQKRHKSFSKNKQTYSKCMLMYFMKKDQNVEVCKITDKMWYEIGIQLSKLSKEKGGFSSNFDECFVTFNQVMFKACMNAVKSRTKNVYDQNGSSGNIFKKIRNMERKIADRKNFIENNFSTYVWMDHTSSKDNLMDEKMFYTIQMLPSHLVRSNMSEKTIALLCDMGFARARAALGITSGAVFYS